MTDIITTEHPAEGVCVVTMSHPAIENQGSWEAISALSAALKQAREAGNRVIVLASGLEDRWLSHAYLRDLVHTFTGKPTTGDPMCWMHALAELQNPAVITIAAVQGVASGGGAELGWACDLRVAEEGASFAQLEASLGLPPGLGGASRLSRLAGRTIAAEAVLDGSPVSAERLYQVGAINRLTPRGQARAEAVAWATHIARHKAEILSAIKQQLIHADHLPLSDALQKEQLLLQQFAFKHETHQRLIAVQARYDAGESMALVHGWKT
jgi:enoyl-CoA hydratase/carnithine racemase